MQDIPDVARNAQVDTIFTAGFAVMALLFLAALLAGAAFGYLIRRQGIYEKYRLNDDAGEMFKRPRVNRGEQ